MARRGSDVFVHTMRCRNNSEVCAAKLAFTGEKAGTERCRQIRQRRIAARARRSSGRSGGSTGESPSLRVAPSAAISPGGASASTNVMSPLREFAVWTTQTPERERIVARLPRRSQPSNRWRNAPFPICGSCLRSRLRTVRPHPCRHQCTSRPPHGGSCVGGLRAECVRSIVLRSCRRDDRWRSSRH